MRQAYALLGVLFIILMIGAAYAVNHSFIKPVDNEKLTEGNYRIMTAEKFENKLQIRSSAFENNGMIPSEYTCDGKREKNPPLEIVGVPAKTKTFALIMDDPDVPKERHPEGYYDHWIVFNIPPPADGQTLEIFEGGPIPGTQGANSAGENAYSGPCPPPQYEPSEHRYFFKLYALDSELPLSEGATKQKVEKAMKDHILEEAQLIGRYKRK